jgi:hypothetical protein
MKSMPRLPLSATSSSRRVLRRAAFVALALTTPAIAAAPASAGVQQLLSQNAAGEAPNAPVESVVISRDARDARYAAYTTAATNLTPGVDGHRNIYLATRAPGYGKFGTPWQLGSTTLVTRGLGGAPANGDSWAPDLDGSSNHDDAIAPRCLAFVSAASNLVSGDTNGKPDVFIRDLRNGKIRRIATKGPASEVSVSGRCDIISWVSGGNVYVQAKSKSLAFGARRVPNSSGATHLAVSEERKKSFVLVFERSGTIRASRGGKASRRVVSGAAPSQDQYGRYVSYERGGKVYQSNLSGAPKERGAVRSGLGDAGRSVSSTAGGVHIFYANGSNVYRNVTKKPEGTCPGGAAAGSVTTSARGNYDVFTCAGGPAYLNYVAGK